MKVAEEAYVPSRTRTIWPALIFAASRNERVKGRESVLVVSTNARKGLNHPGVPRGTRLAMSAVGLNFKAERM